MAKLTAEEREILINALVENEAIEEDDRDMYEGLKDENLIRFADIALNADGDDDDDDDADDDDDETEVVDNSDESEDDDEEDGEDFEDDDEESDEEPATNAHVCNSCAGKMKGKKGKKAPAPEEDDEEDMTGNMTAEEWFNNAPPEVAEVVANAMKIANEEKAKLIDQMTANMSGAQKKQAIQIYAQNTLEELKVLAPSMIQNSQGINVGQIPGMTRRNFAGAGNPAGTTNNSKGKQNQSAPLIMPTINWAEASKEFAAQN